MLQHFRNLYSSLYNFVNKGIFIEYQRSKDSWFTSKKVESKNVKRTKARRSEAGVHCTVYSTTAVSDSNLNLPQKKLKNIQREK